MDAAAAIVDAVFQRLLRSDYGPAVAAAHRLGVSATAAAGDLGPSAKRPRLAHPMLPQQRAFGRGPGSGGAAAAAAAAAGGGGLEDGEDDILTAFMNGEEGIGASNTRVRCVCSDHKRKEPMLQCEGAFCGVWQHAGCVKQQLLHSPLVPHPPGSDKWPKRRQFFCERCRCVWTRLHQRQEACDRGSALGHVACSSGGSSSCVEKHEPKQQQQQLCSVLHCWQHDQCLLQPALKLQC